MVEGAAQERPNLPKRLDSIEDLLRSAHEIVSRMQPLPDSDEKAPTTDAGIESAVARVEQSLQHLNTRLVGIAERVGQL